MKKCNKSILQLSAIAIFALFPGFFFYHTAAAIQLIPPVLAGYFTPVCLIMAPFLLVLYVREIANDKKQLTYIDYFFFLFNIYFIFIISFNDLFRDVSKETVRSHYLAVLHFVTLFIIFKFADFNDRTFWWSLVIAWIVMTIIVFSLASDGFFYLRQQQSLVDNHSIATYQGFARSYMVTVLIIVPFIKHLHWRIAVYTLSIAALFVNGARSEFIAILIAFCVIEALRSKHKITTFICGIMIVTLFDTFLPLIVEALPENRILELLDLSNANSWQLRHELFSESVETIMASPIFGDYANYAEAGVQGTYAHNILSAWVDTGLIGFIWLSAMLLVPLFYLVSDTLSRQDTNDNAELLLAFILFISTIFLLITSKNFTFMLIGAALGRYAHRRYRQRHNGFSQPSHDAFTLGHHPGQKAAG